MYHYCLFSFNKNILQIFSTPDISLIYIEYIKPFKHVNVYLVAHRKTQLAILNNKNCLFYSLILCISAFILMCLI